MMCIAPSRSHVDTGRVNNVNAFLPSERPIICSLGRYSTDYPLGGQMSRATVQMRSFAKRLIAYEALGKKLPRPPAIFHVSEKLRPQLATLMGKGGFQALLSRALGVAMRKFPGCARCR